MVLVLRSGVGIAHGRRRALTYIGRRRGGPRPPTPLPSPDPAGSAPGRAPWLAAACSCSSSQPSLFSSPEIPQAAASGRSLSALVSPGLLSPPQILKVAALSELSGFWPACGCGTEISDLDAASPTGNGGRLLLYTGVFHFGPAVEPCMAMEDQWRSWWLYLASSLTRCRWVAWWLSSSRLSPATMDGVVSFINMLSATSIISYSV